jgi:hypothetical protein
VSEFERGLHVVAVERAVDERSMKENMQTGKKSARRWYAKGRVASAQFRLRGIQMK